MPFTTQKNVNFVEDQRVDVDDLTAISTLKDADFREMMTVLMEPGVNGTVLTGFDGVGSTLSLAWTLLGVDSAAIDADGNVLEMLSSAPLSVALPANVSCYIHAYAIEQDSDSDARRFLNDIPTPPEEYSLVTPTRKSKLVGLYVTSNADVTLLQSSFQTTAFISGKNRKLVALAACKTNGTGVIAFSNVDFRNMWMVSGNQIPTINGGVNDLPFAIGSSGGDRNVKGIRTMFKALASVLRTISGATGQDWWNPPTTLQEVIDARTDLQNAVVQTTLSRRIQAAKTAFATVHPTVGVADFTSVASAIAAVTRGVVHLKAGDHTEGFLNLDNKASFVLRGDGTGATKLTLSSFVRMQGTITALTIEDMTLEVTDAVLLELSAVSCANILFRNCSFRRLGASSVGGLANINTVGTNVRFENCFFEWSGSACFEKVSLSGNNVMFSKCSFYPTTVNDQLFTIGQPVLNARFHDCIFNEPGRPEWRGIGRLGTNGSYKADFLNCEWNNLSECVNVLSGDAYLDLTFTGNRFRRSSTLATAPLFSRNAGGDFIFSGDKASSVTLVGCSVMHGNTIVNIDRPNFLVVVKNSDFWINVPSTAAPLFVVSNVGVNALPQVFKGCRFFCGNHTAGTNGAAIQVVSGAGSALTGTRITIEGCEFTGAKTPDDNTVFAVGPTNFLYTLIQNAGVQFHLQVQSCVFHRYLSANLPIYAEHTVGAGKGSYYYDYLWGNNTDSNETDTGISQFFAGSYRLEDVRQRMNTAGATT